MKPPFPTMKPPFPTMKPPFSTMKPPFPTIAPSFLREASVSDQNIAMPVKTFFSL